MDAKLYQQIKEIVTLLWVQPKEQWTELLDEYCRDNQNLRDEVDAFLAENVSDDFLEKKPIGIDFINDDALSGKIGRIKIDRLIAKGGMGEVYAGVDETLKREVAIKVMNSGMGLSKQHRKDFLNEAQVLSSLKHPNICQIYDFFEDQGRDVLVMELIDGKTLRQLLDSKNVQNPLDIAIQIIDALTTAHERGIIHRDLKPDNIMLTALGEVKILDFGLARSGIDSPQVSSNQLSPKKTQVSGTPGYMSPEQARGEQSSSATDLWSFGIVLSELLTGNKPFSEKSTSEQLLEQAKKAQSNLPKNLPNAETNLLSLLTLENGQDRPTARAVKKRLKQIKERPKKRLKFAMILASLSLILLSLWKYTYDLKKEQQKALQAQNHAEQQREFAINARDDAENLISFMLDDLHKDLRKLGKLDLLESVANQAKDYYDKLTDEQLQASDGKLALVLVNLAEVLTDTGQNDDAINLLEQAKETFNKFHSDMPGNDLLTYRYGFILYNLGDLYKLGGQYLKARKEFEQAVILGEQLTKGLKPGMGTTQAPNATLRWRLLLRSQYLLADSYARFGGAGQAAIILEKTVELAISAAKTNKELIINLSDIQFKRCDVYSELNKPLMQLQACIATLELDKALHEKYPENYEYHKNLLGDYNLVSRIYTLLKRYDEALIAINEGLLQGDLLIDWDTSNANTKNEYVGVLLAKARLLKAMDKQKESQKLFKQAYDIIMPIAKDHEEITFMNHAFITLVHLGYRQKAANVAMTLELRGFKRRDFKELCVQYNITECIDER